MFCFLSEIREVGDLTKPNIRPWLIQIRVGKANVVDNLIEKKLAIALIKIWISNGLAIKVKRNWQFNKKSLQFLHNNQINIVK